MTIGKTALKTLSYGMMHMSIAILVAYALSGSLKVALAIGLIEPCIQTIAFYFHERAWHALEQKERLADKHDSVIDSVSPLSGVIERLLKRLGRAASNDQ